MDEKYVDPNEKYVDIYEQADEYWQTTGVEVALDGHPKFSDFLRSHGLQHPPKIERIQSLDKKMIRVHFKTTLFGFGKGLPPFDISKRYAGGRIELVRDIYPAMRK